MMQTQKEKNDASYLQLEDLPDDARITVFRFLDPASLLTLQQTSKRMQTLVNSYVDQLISRGFLVDLSGGSLSGRDQSDVLRVWMAGSYTLTPTSENIPDLIAYFDRACMKVVPTERGAFLSICSQSAEQNQNGAASQQFFQYIQALLGMGRLVDKKTGVALKSNIPVKAVILGLYNGNILWQAPLCLFKSEVASGLQEAYQQPGTHIPADLCAKLVALIQNFNSCAKVMGAASEDTLRDQYACLDQIEDIAYKWQCESNVEATDADREAIRALLRATEENQIHLVLKSYWFFGTPLLWISPTIDSKTATEMKSLWLSIAGKKGNIQIVSTDQHFICSIWVSIAKLLQTHHGRAMLSILNAPQSKPGMAILIAESWEAEFAKSDIKEWKPGSWALPYAGIRDEKDQSHCKKGVGTGSYVQIQCGETLWLVGEQGEPLYMPEFITLGHELGHALHNLKGESRLFDEVKPGQPGIGASEAEFIEWSSLWSEWEEFQNINNNENKLRAEAGLPKRKYHADWYNAQICISLQKRVDKLMVAINRLLEEVPDSCPFPELNQLTSLVVSDWARICTEGEAGPSKLQQATILVEKAEVLLKVVQEKKAAVLAAYRCEQAQTKAKPKNDDDKCITM